MHDPIQYSNLPDYVRSAEKVYADLLINFSNLLKKVTYHSTIQPIYV